MGEVIGARLIFRFAQSGHTHPRVFLTALTVLAGAALGGGIAVDVTAIVIIAAIALALLAAVNGVRMLGEMSDSLD
jgi:hypothetical protein